MENKLCSKHIVLLGVGHTNAHIVRMWGMHPIDDVDLTCISNQAIATYSGMLPAALAGQIPIESMEIDLVRLCASVGARLILAPVNGLDHARQTVCFEERPPIPFDALSIGIGSIPTHRNADLSGDSVLMIKPMQTFLKRLEATVANLQTDRTHPVRVAIVGSGVAGVEIAFCLPHFLRRLGLDSLEMHVVTRSPTVLPGCTSGLRRRVMREFDRRHVRLSTGKTVIRVDSHEFELEDSTKEAADIVIWATGASPPPLLGRLELPLSENGFIATDECLRSVSGKPIFAVGDSGTIVDQNLPKAGVFAVRQGPVLWENLQRVLSGKKLTPYKPQRSFLKLLNAGNGSGLGEWHGLTLAGRWVMKLKELIDNSFIAKYQPLAMDGGNEAMQCRGCGSKLGATALDTALGSTVPLADAAEIESSPGLIASTDFFSSPVDDAYLSGRIAALHAGSDVIVSSAQVTHALANVVLPYGDVESQQRLLSDFLEGARREFTAMGAKIVGGHTIVGPRLEVGFTVIGKAFGKQLVRKSNLKAGDQLFLTKPLGIGVLLAAHMRNQCAARDYEHLIETMLQPQHAFAKIVSDLRIDAGTDITGFGLAGHLVEMLVASDTAAELALDAVPTLEGAVDAVESGIESSLIDENLRAEHHVDALISIRKAPKYRLLFDPQTCGGLLFGCTEREGTELLEAAVNLGLNQPICIGRVVSRQETSDTKLLCVRHQLPQSS